MKKCIITIGRQCGSDGHTIGKNVAEWLEIPFYDKKLVQIVAERSGLSLETVWRESEYSASSSLLTSAGTRGYSAYNTGKRENMTLPDQINAYQTELIKKLADKGSCVIVDRCADYILQGRKAYRLSLSKMAQMVLPLIRQKAKSFAAVSSKQRQLKPLLR